MYTFIYFCTLFDDKRHKNGTLCNIREVVINLQVEISYCLMTCYAGHTLGNSKNFQLDKVEEMWNQVPVSEKKNEEKNINIHYKGLRCCYLNTIHIIGLLHREVTFTQQQIICLYICICIVGGICVKSNVIVLLAVYYYCKMFKGMVTDLLCI